MVVVQSSRTEPSYREPLRCSAIEYFSPRPIGPNQRVFLAINLSFEALFFELLTKATIARCKHPELE